MKNYKYIILLAASLLFGACDIKEDIPYPIVYGQITEFEVESQCGADGGTSITSTIDKDKRQITLYVNDAVDLKRLRVTKITLSGVTYNPDVDYQDKPVLVVDTAKCQDYKQFPQTSFKNLGANRNTRVDFSSPVEFVVRTYQDYVWTVKVIQVIPREIEVDNQIGNAIIDAEQQNALVYVSPSQDLTKLKVHKFSIGGPRGTVEPDPTKEEYNDFFNMRKFTITTGWGETQVWRVTVVHTNEEIKTSATAFARNHQAIVSGNMPNGSDPLVEYREKGKPDWMTVDKADITTKSTTYKAVIQKLKPGTQYEYKVSTSKDAVDVQEFSTAPVQQIPNGSFDEWHTDANNSKLYCPWASGGQSYWDTGNRGATTVGDSNSFPTNDTSTGSGKAVHMVSKYIVIKFAAGNIFTGTYLKTDGTNGILGFGRPFTAFPDKVSFDYKYTSMPIDKVGDTSMEYLKGRPDSCNIYVALWHVEDGDYEQYQGEKYPLVIRTKPGKDQNLFSVNDRRVIAYGNFTSGASTSSWTNESIELTYRNLEVAPTHILIVASSSKYGDFFTGGVGSTLIMDNMKLIYE